MSENDTQFFGLILVFLKLVVLSMVLERAMILLFEWRWYERFFGGRGLKVPITYMVALAICKHLKFNVFYAIMNPLVSAPNEVPDGIGIYLTAAVLAGGSAGAITLFQGVMRMTKSAQQKQNPTLPAVPPS